MKYSSVIIKVVFGIALASIVIFLTINSGNKISINVPTIVKQNDLSQINIEITNNLKKISPKEVTIEFYSVLNKEEYLKQVVVPYKDGEYSIVVTPHFKSDYVINVTATNDKESFSASQEFKVVENDEKK